MSTFQNKWGGILSQTHGKQFVTETFTQRQSECKFYIHTLVFLYH